MARMFVTKDRPGAGSQIGQDRTIEETASPMGEHESLGPFAERARGRGEAARVALKRRLRASVETLQGLIEASLQGVLAVTGFGSTIASIQTGGRIAKMPDDTEPNLEIR